MAGWSPETRAWIMLLVAFVAALMAHPSAARAQGVDPENRPVARIGVEGLSEVPEQLVRNQLRIQVGDPYNATTVEQDVVRITHLGRFEQVRAQVTPLEDGTVALTYVVSEQRLLADVGFAGNKAISDQDLSAAVLLRAGDPADPFLLDRALRQVREAYQDRGYFVADVSVDQALLDSQHILIFRIREGPKVRIRQIRFEGNTSYSGDELSSRIESDAYFPIFDKGLLSREQLELDASRIREFYQDRGYQDAQVGRRIDLSPNQRDATVTFLVEEGPQYTVGRVRIEGAEVFTEEQIRMNLAIAPGDVYAADKVRESRRLLADLYGKLGYLFPDQPENGDSRIAIQRVFHDNEPKVDLIVTIDEGTPTQVGTVSVRGNAVTKSNVVLRQVRGMEPGRRFDNSGVEETRRRLRETPLFRDATITMLGDPGNDVRDVIIDVQEQNTGSILFGAGVSSDAGVIGAVELNQKNFDITDFPDSWGEVVSGQAFRGGGQYFSISLQPGDETSRYSIDFREPRLFETDYSLDTSLFYFSRERNVYDEERAGGGLGIGQRFGDIWSGTVRARAAQIDITNIEDDAPVDVFDVEGDSLITSLGIEARRDTTDSNFFPSRGTRLEIGLEQVGALGGDYNFTRTRGEFYQFWTVDQDFFGRKSIVRWRVEWGYIFQQEEAPVFERFYAGGHSTFRGFDFRGIGPRGIENDSGELGDESVGGDWLFLTGLEYTQPLYEDSVRWAVFTDMGTLQDDFGFDEWRVSVGAGLRIKIPFLGEAPFAIDVAVPIMKESGDETRLISFDLALPFR